MAKETTYQRIKKENEELKRQLIIVTQHPQSSEADLITMQWRIRADTEKAMWFGNSTTSTPLND